MADMQYHIGKPDTGETRTREDVEQTLPAHVLAAMAIEPVERPEPDQDIMP